MESNKLKKQRVKSRKFLHYFKNGFTDSKYKNWERDYKWNAHLAWEKELYIDEFKRLLKEGKYSEIANRAVKLETKINLVAVVANLPRKQTRVLTWPLLTVFGFLADPKKNLFLKPKVTKAAAEKLWI